MPLNEWPVRVFDDGKRNGGGSGLLIGSRRVLTCAHVVDDMARPMVRFPARRELGDLPATAEISKQWRSDGDHFGDLAVLNLNRPVPITPARFAARHVLESGLHDLVAIGFPLTADERGRIAAVTATSSQMLLQGEWMQLESQKEFGPNVGKGYSGGAVALRSTLEVVGMITAADKVDRLGLMLPLSKLVRYREDLADLLPLGPVGPEAHRQLHTLLAGVSLADADRAYQLAVHDELLPDLPGADLLPDRGLAYGVARYIAEELFLEDRQGHGIRSALARLCLQVADEATDPQLSNSLRDWVSRHGDLRTRSCGHPSPPSKSTYRVSVQVERSGVDTHSMLLKVAVQPSGGQATHRPVETVAARRVQSAVQELLPTVINDHVPPDGSLIVEFVLPRGWLSKPVDEWTLGGDGLVQIGWRHPVVVRDLARSKDRERSVRWTNVIRADVRTDIVYWVRCRDAATATQLTASLTQQSQRAVLALTNPPVPGASSPVLRAGFESGMPAILWHRIPCRDHDASERGSVTCEGRQFERAISTELNAFLTRAPVLELPELVRRLRANAGQTPTTEQHCGRALTLVWDPPEQMTPPAPLALAVSEGAPT